MTLSHWEGGMKAKQCEGWEGELSSALHMFHPKSLLPEEGAVPQSVGGAVLELKGTVGDILGT